MIAGKRARWRARKLLKCQKIKTYCLDKRSGIILNSKQWELTKGKCEGKKEKGFINKEKNLGGGMSYH